MSTYRSLSHALRDDPYYVKGEYNAKEKAFVYPSGMKLSIQEPGQASPQKKRSRTSQRRPVQPAAYQVDCSGRPPPPPPADKTIKIHCPLKFKDVYSGDDIRALASEIVGEEAWTMPIEVEYVDEDDDDAGPSTAEYALIE